MTTNYVLVDFENVQPDLSMLANTSFRVKVFFGAKQQEGRVPFKLLDAMLALAGNVEPIKVMRSGSNAVDMHIAYYVGRLVEKEPAAEIHMVHKTPGGRIAVVGTWIRVGARNREWDEIWAHLPSAGAPPRNVTVSIERLFGFRDLNAERVYRYCGSLTTPDYAIGVTWLMRRTAITLSRAQLDQLHHVMGRYSRDVQPLGGRVIRYRRP